jgi:hypothetical protein
LELCSRLYAKELDASVILLLWSEGKGGDNSCCGDSHCCSKHFAISSASEASNAGHWCTTAITKDLIPRELNLENCEAWVRKLGEDVGSLMLDSSGSGVVTYWIISAMAWLTSWVQDVPGHFLAI